MAILQTTGITGSLAISSSGLTTGSVLLSVDGLAGRLFAIDDNLSGSLFSVNTIAGLPVIEAFSDNTVNIGKYNAEAIRVTDGGQSVAFGSGSKMYVSSSGNVGIGTTTPIAKLQVNGNISASSFTSSISNAVGFLGTASWANNAITASYVNVSALNAFVQGGNSFGTTATLGTNDNQPLVFETSGSARMRIDSSGNVGIGTSSPNTLLNVHGTNPFVRINNTTNGDQGIKISYNNSDAHGLNLIYNPSTATSYIDNTYQVTSNQVYGDIYFRQNVSGVMTTRMTIKADGGNVGIGTTNPSYKTEIYSSAKTSSFTGLAISNFNDYDGTAASFVTSQLRFAIRETAVDASQRTFSILESGNELNNSSTNGFFAISTRLSSALTERFRITSAGNVGIGTNSPAYLLDVSGSSRFGYTSTNIHQFTGSVNISGSLNATASWAVNSVTASRANSLDPSNSYTVNGLTANYVEVTGLATIPTTGIYRPATKTLGLSADGTLILKISNVASPATSSIETGNFIVQSGNVGIGSQNPVNKLDVLGNISASVVTASLFLGTASWANNSSTASFLPVGTYNITSSWANNAITASYVNVSALNAFIQNGNSFGTTATLGTNDVQPLAFETSGSERMRIANDGLVGIGTTSPSYLLDIYKTTNDAIARVKTAAAGAYLWLDSAVDGYFGTVMFSGSTGRWFLGGYGTSDLQIKRGAADTGTELVRITSGGNVGIGTSSPGALLHVSGSITSTVGIFQGYVGIGTTNAIYPLQVRRPGGVGSLGISIDNYLGASTRDVLLKVTPDVVSDTGGFLFRSYNGADIDALAILANGNVGIGTNNPTNKLQINGTVSGSSFTSSINNAVGFVGTASWANNSSTASFLPVGTYNITSSWSTTSTNALALGGVSSATWQTYFHTSSWSFALSPNSLYVTFDQNAPTGSPDNTRWYNGFVSTHNSYLPSYIINAHRTDDWYLGWRDTINNNPASSSSTTGFVNWRKILHDTNYTDYTVTKTGISASGNWTITSSWANNSLTASYLTPTNSYTITNLTASNISASATGSFGAVNIGTSTLRNQLTVIGPAQATSAVSDSGNGGGTIFVGSSLNAVDQGGTLLFSTINDLGTYLPQWSIKTLFTNGNGNGVSDLAFSSRTTGSATALTEQIRFKSNGNVGIGTTSTSAKVTIQATSSGNDLGISNANLPLYVKTYGGTSSSVRNMFVGHLYTSSDTDFSTSQITLISANNLAAQSVAIALTSNNALAFYTNGGNPAADSLVGTERLRINSSGNVGIGTSSPAYLLDVSGSSRHGYTATNTHQFTGSVNISGSLNATSSWANNSSTASALVTTNNYTINNLSANVITSSLDRPDYFIETYGYTDAAKGLTPTITAGSFNQGGPTFRSLDSYWTVPSSSVTSPYPTMSIDLINPAGANQLSVVSFGTYYKVDSRFIPYSYRIDTSTDNSTWTNQVAVTTNTNLTPIHALTGEFRYIRLILLSGQTSASVANGWACQISAFRVHSYRGSFVGDGYWGQKLDGSNVYFAHPNNLGIGTTSPAAKLHVQASGGAAAAFLSGSDPLAAVANAYIYAPVATGFSNSPVYRFWYQNTGIGNPASETLAFYTNNSEKVRLTSGGNLGVGTSSPSYLLDVSGSSARINTSDGAGLILGSTKPVTLFNYSLYGSNGSQLWAINQSGVGDVISLALGANFSYAKSVELTYATSSGEFRIGSQGSSAGTHKSINLIVNNTSSVFITGSTSGYSSVGIGTTSPNSFVNSNSTYFTPSASSSFLTLYSKNNDASINLVSSASADGAVVGGLYFTRERGQTDAHYHIAGIRALQSGTSATLAGGKLYFYTKVDGSGTPSNIPQMSIISNGYAGIGVASPVARLHVSASSTAGENIILSKKGANSIAQNHFVARAADDNASWWLQSDQNSHIEESFYYNGVRYCYFHTYWSSYINPNNYSAAGGLSIGANNSNHGYGLYIAKPSISGSLNVSGSSIFTGSISVQGILQSQQYAIPETGASAQWVKIGTITLPQFGFTAHIRSYIHSGYNALNSQDFYLDVFFKTSNNSSVDTNGFAGNSWYFTKGFNNWDPTPKWVANIAGIGATSYDLYLYLPNFTNLSHYVVENVQGGSWQNIGTTGATNPGTGSSTVCVSSLGFNIPIGNVGIGTTSPNAPLDVLGSANTAILRNTTAGSYGGLRIYNDQNSQLRSLEIDYAGSSYASSLLTNGPTGESAAITTTGAYPLVLGTSNTARMTILSGGNVGIGTITPNSKLEVAGNASSPPIISVYHTTQGRSGSLGIDTSGVYIQNSNNGDYFDLKNASGTSKFRVIYDNNTFLNTTYTSVGSLTASGSKLSVFGNLSVGSTYGSTPAPTDGMIVEGNVGIGTTSPSSKLDISGSSSTTIFSLKSPTSQNIMFVSGSGRIGIGTNNPDALVTISGSTPLLMTVKCPADASLIQISGSGNIGIGTSAVSTYKLQVNGAFAASTKSFVIDHPTKEGKKLVYGSLESPYHGVRLTGRNQLKEGKCKVELPDYINKLILHDSVNIQLTGIKCGKVLYVDQINILENYFTIAYDKTMFESYKDYEFFWDFTAVRADVPELLTEM